MLSEGVNLMAVGMTTVFGFLALLVVLLQISARFFEKVGDRWPDSRVTPGLSGASVETNEAVAVALAAVAAHRRKQE
jgi:sodium pump decarboxylase gamma subunit